MRTVLAAVHDVNRLHRFLALSTCILPILLSACHSTTAVIVHQSGDQTVETQGTIVGSSFRQVHVQANSGPSVQIERDKIVSVRHPGERGALVGGVFTIAGATLLAAGAVFLALQPLDDGYNNVMVAVPLVTLSTLGFGIGIPTFLINQGRESDSLERMSPVQKNYTLGVHGSF